MEARRHDERLDSLAAICSDKSVALGGQFDALGMNHGWLGEAYRSHDSVALGGLISLPDGMTQDLPGCLAPFLTVSLNTRWTVLRNPCRTTTAVARLDSDGHDRAVGRR
jgi:hypothetical protein